MRRSLRKLEESEFRFHCLVALGLFKEGEELLQDLQRMADASEVSFQENLIAGEVSLRLSQGRYQEVMQRLPILARSHNRGAWFARHKQIPEMERAGRSLAATDDQGRSSITSVPPGSYTLIVRTREQRLWSGVLVLPFSGPLTLQAASIPATP